MEISFPHLVGSFFSAAVAYFILSLQVHAGFPPFYRRRSWIFFAGLDEVDERLIRRVIPFVAGIMVMLVLSILTGLAVLSLLAGVIAVCAGLWLRRDLFRLTGGPLPWLTHPWTVRWPMLVFDVWTLGIALGFGLLVLH